MVRFYWSKSAVTHLNKYPDKHWSTASNSSLKFKNVAEMYKPVNFLVWKHKKDSQTKKMIVNQCP